LRFASIGNNDDSRNAGNPFNQIGAKMGYAADYDARERFGDLPREVYVDVNGGGIVRAMVDGVLTVLQVTREEYTNLPPETGFINVAAQIVSGHRWDFGRR
jgi:hypothetical protein